MPCGSSGISLRTIRSDPLRTSSILMPPEERFELRFELRLLLAATVLCLSVRDVNFFELNDVWISLIIVRRIGMHWTMIVPVISEEYQTWESPLRPGRSRR